MTDNKHGFKLVAVRYQVKDTERAVEFYTKHLGFELIRVAGPVGLISNNGVQIWLSGPGSSGSRDLPDGETQEPGGSNRIALEVSSIETIVERLRQEGVKFRNDLQSGPGGKQIQIEDPDGNPIELFEPAAH